VTDSPRAGPGTGFAAVHHVGVTVADLERSAAFWEALLGVAARDHRTLEGPGVSTMVGYPDVRIRRCWVDLPGGVALLELLQRTVAGTEARLGQIDESARAVSGRMDSASRLAYLAFSNPVIKAMALGTGTSRAARAFRRR
jgi:catechol 2,3-dioxygenase-like lactoylglutathione lyase family enzyme